MDRHYWIRYLAYHLIIMVGLLCAAVVSAQSLEQEEIQKVMVAQWQRPDAPLTVAPIIVVGDDAIAGWTQGNRGGRALLRRQNGAWQVYVCGGDGLKQISTLQQAGIDHQAAQLLTTELALAEANLSSNERKQFSTFEGIAPVDSNYNARHSQHHD